MPAPPSPLEALSAGSWPTDPLPLLVSVAGLLLGLSTLRSVYRGGTTWNDHLVALVVTGCMAVYPVLSWGAAAEGLGSPGLGSWVLHGLFLAGEVGIAGLFFVLDRRVEARALLPLAIWSQPSYAFALWAGLVGVFWLPGSLLVRALGWGAPNPCWPGLLLLPPLLLTVWGTIWTYARANRVARLRLSIPGLEGRLRVAHLSDVHASPTMTGPHLREMVRRVNAEQPDLVVVTGDLLMPYSELHHAYLLEALAGLRAPTFACAGNHDLPVLETLRRELALQGQPMLVDERVHLELGGQRVELVGAAFHWRGVAPALDALLDALPPEPGVGLRLLLGHDPRVFRDLRPGRFDLVLSGHTHGGQVAADMFGWPASVLRLFGVYDQGLFERGGTRLYVHRGNWHTGLPPRLGVASEIVIFDLEPPSGR